MTDAEVPQQPFCTGCPDHAACMEGYCYLNGGPNYPQHPVADPALAEKFRRLLKGEVTGYAQHAWQELAQVAAEHYAGPQGCPFHVHGLPLSSPIDLVCTCGDPSSANEGAERA